MHVRRFETGDTEQWDEFCEQALNATLLHTCRYLSYHGNRFQDESLIIEDEKGRMIGLFPAARDPKNGDTVTTHPGITYGGVIHAGRLVGERMLETLDTLKAHYRAAGYLFLVYKAVPHIYHRSPAQDDLYALFRHNAQRFRCDLSTTVRPEARLRKSERRRRALKKAEKANVTIEEGTALIEPLWQVLRANLAEKHEATPVHSEAQMRLLAERFPENIRIITGWCNNELVAGVVVFVAGPAHHAQYIAASPKGHEVNALDIIFEACIARAEREGADWFDFGISNENQGRYLNSNLYRFKSEFGGGGTVHEFYQLDLKGAF